MAHDVNEETSDVEPEAPHSWYVWRRSDGFVGITAIDPTVMFTSEYRYVVLDTTPDTMIAYHLAAMARSAN